MVFVRDIKIIDASITICATYEDSIRITIEDRKAGVEFVELELTREQFINAALNRLGNTEVKKTIVRDLDRVGKKMEMGVFEFEIPEDISKFSEEEKEFAIKHATKCPDGWLPDLGFNRQDSFFNKDGKRYARTTIRRWI